MLGFFILALEIVRDSLGGQIELAYGSDVAKRSERRQLPRAPSELEGKQIGLRFGGSRVELPSEEEREIFATGRTISILFRQCESVCERGQAALRGEA